MSATDIAPGNQTLDLQTYKDILHGMDAGFAVFEVILGEAGKAEDLAVIDANAAFSEILGKKLEDIEGRRITAILPGIHTWDFKWIKALAKIARTGQADTIVEYAEGSVRKWLSFQAAGPQPGVVAALITDVTEEQRMKNALALERNNLSY